MLQISINIFKFVSKIIIFIPVFRHFFIHLVYWKNDQPERRGNEYLDDGDHDERRQTFRKFVINRPGECTNSTQYGFARGRPCVLVKMNKVNLNISKNIYKNIHFFKLDC